jgi:hypothetical protein
MMVAACCCVMLSCKQMLASYCLMLLTVSLFAISLSRIPPTAVIRIGQLTLSCKQPLQPFAAAPAA